MTTENCPMRIGVDASIWFYAIMVALRKLALNAQRGPNPKLTTMLYKFCHLLSLPFSLVISIDGPQRAPFKHGKKVLNPPYWLLDSFCCLTEIFKHKIHQAPGDAEAELAVLNQCGLIDAVLMEDSDAFVYSALTVIQSYALWNPDTIAVYCLQDIMYNLVFPIMPSGLLMLATLGGSDQSIMIGYQKGACIMEKWKTKLYDEKLAQLSLCIHFKQ
ncbi:hypothetical protein WG66_003510 [Moniliophthora roreri]|nr:hypothetical protein WG66_003510 [Moniliophthora roreri]